MGFLSYVVPEKSTAYQNAESTALMGQSVTQIGQRRLWRG